MPLRFRNAFSPTGAMSWAKGKRLHKIFCAQDAQFTEEVGSSSKPPIVKEPEVIYVLPSLSNISSPLLPDSTWCTSENCDSGSSNEGHGEITAHKKPCLSQLLPGLEAHYLPGQPLRSAIEFPSLKYDAGDLPDIEDSLQMMPSHPALVDDLQSPMPEIVTVDNIRRKKAVSISQARKFSLHSMPKPDYRCISMPSEPRAPQLDCQSAILPSVFEDDSDDEQPDQSLLKKTFLRAPHSRTRPASHRSPLLRHRVSRLSTS